MCQCRCSLVRVYALYTVGWQRFSPDSGTDGAPRLHSAWESLAPTPHRLVADGNAALSRERLNIPQAKAEHVVQPDSGADDLGEEPVAVVGIGWRLHTRRCECRLEGPRAIEAIESALRNFPDSHGASHFE
jgi:hypothetical protein